MSSASSCDVFANKTPTYTAVDLESSGCYMFALGLVSYTLDPNVNVQDKLMVVRRVSWPSDTEAKALEEEYVLKKEKQNGFMESPDCVSKRFGVFKIWDWRTFQFWSQHKAVFDKLQESAVEDDEFWRQIYLFRMRHPGDKIVTDCGAFDLCILDAEFRKHFNIPIYQTPAGEYCWPVDIDAMWDGIRKLAPHTTAESYKTLMFDEAALLQAHNPIDDAIFIAKCHAFIERL